MDIYKNREKNRLGENVFSSSIKGLLFIQNNVFEDDRGFFREFALVPELDKHIQQDFVVKQFNHSHSKENVIRGFHIGSWNKLISVVHGEALCVLVDVRPSSPTYKTVEYFKLGFREDSLVGSLFIPVGIANAFAVVRGPVDYVYGVDKLFKNKEANEDLAFSIFDPEINVSWPIEKQKIILSERDKKNPTLREIEHLL